MNTYRKNAVMVGVLYFLGTVFGVSGALIGGEVLTSIISGKALELQNIRRAGSPWGRHYPLAEVTGRQWGFGFLNDRGG